MSGAQKVRSELTRLIKQSRCSLIYAFPKPGLGVERLNIAQASIDDEPGSDLDVYVTLFDRIDHPETVMGCFSDLFDLTAKRQREGRKTSCSWSGWLRRIPEHSVEELLDMDWVVTDPHHPLVLLAQQAEEDD